MVTLANWVATGAGFHEASRQWGVFMVGPDEHGWLIPTDEATVRALIADGMPEQTA